MGLQFLEAATVAIAILVTVIATTKTLLTGIDLFDMAEQRREASQRAQQMMEDLVTDLLQLPPSSLLALSETSFAWKEVEKGSVRYALGIAGGAMGLYRNQRMIAPNIAFLDFDFKTLQGDATRDPKQVKRINIDFSIAALKRAGNIRLRTEVFPRSALYEDFEIDERVGEDTASSLRAFYAAQAGIEYALRQIQEGRDASGERAINTSHFRVQTDQPLHRLLVRGVDGDAEVLLSIRIP